MTTNRNASLKTLRTICYSSCANSVWTRFLEPHRPMASVPLGDQGVWTRWGSGGWIGTGTSQTWTCYRSTTSTTSTRKGSRYLSWLSLTQNKRISRMNIYQRTQMRTETRSTTYLTWMRTRLKRKTRIRVSTPATSLTSPTNCLSLGIMTDPSTKTSLEMSC